jgi:hypothetical protein
MANEPLPTHSKCPHCGYEQRMSPWVYAHWNIPIVATCDKPLGGCGKQYGVQRGVVYINRRYSPKGIGGS